MARSARMLPIASAGGYARISVAAADWALIERGYCPLSETTRADIVDATNKFLQWEGFERNAQPAGSAESHIKSVKRSAQNLSTKIIEHLAGANDTQFYASQLIKKHFYHPNRKRNDPADGLYAILSSFIVSCHKALEELQDPDAFSFREGECWNQWIRRLTAIARRYGLPAGVAKDSDKRTRPSPFLFLVAELQNRIPQAAARHSHSPEALAAAIHRARQASRRVTNRPRRRQKKSRPNQRS